MGLYCRIQIIFVDPGMAASVYISLSLFIILSASS